MLGIRPGLAKLEALHAVLLAPSQPSSFGNFCLCVGMWFYCLVFGPCLVVLWHGSWLCVWGSFLAVQGPNQGILQGVLPTEQSLKHFIVFVHVVLGPYSAMPGLCLCSRVSLDWCWGTIFSSGVIDPGLATWKRSPLNQLGCLSGQLWFFCNFFGGALGAYSWLSGYKSFWVGHRDHMFYWGLDLGWLLASALPAGLSLRPWK